LSSQIAEKRQVLEAFSKDFNREMHNLQEMPDTIWQQMYNRLQWADGPAKDGPVTEVIAPEFYKRTSPKARPWFHLNSRLRESGALIRTLIGHTSTVTSCAFSPDGSRIVSASYDNTLELWDAESGAELATLTGHTNSVLSCAFSPRRQQDSLGKR